VSILGAILSNEFIALLVHILHVVPPERLVAIIHQLLVKADLSNIFHDDVFAKHEHICGFIVVGGAVLAIAKALILLELLCAGRTAPSNESGRELNIA